MSNTLFYQATVEPLDLGVMPDAWFMQSPAAIPAKALSIAAMMFVALPVPFDPPVDGWLNTPQVAIRAERKVITGGSSHVITSDVTTPTVDAWFQAASMLQLKRPPTWDGRFAFVEPEGTFPTNFTWLPNYPEKCGAAPKTPFGLTALVEPEGIFPVNFGWPGDYPDTPPPRPKTPLGLISFVEPDALFPLTLGWTNIYPNVPPARPKTLEGRYTLVEPEGVFPVNFSWPPSYPQTPLIKPKSVPLGQSALVIVGLEIVTVDKWYQPPSMVQQERPPTWVGEYTFVEIADLAFTFLHGTAFSKPLLGGRIVAQPTLNGDIDAKPTLQDNVRVNS